MAELGFGGMQSPSLSVEKVPTDSLQSFFIKFDGIKGESMDSDHKGEIDVLSWSYAVTQSTSMAMGGGGGVGRANFGNFMFTHYSDISSPNLMTYCADGKHVPTVTFVASKVGGAGKLQEYYKITFTDVLITALRVVGATNSPRSIEEVAFSYSKIKVETKSQNADGSMGAPVTGEYDVKMNKRT